MGRQRTLNGVLGQRKVVMSDDEKKAIYSLAGVLRDLDIKFPVGYRWLIIRIRNGRPVSSEWRPA